MFSGQSLAFRRSGVVSQAQSDQFWFSIRYRSRRVRVPVRHEGAHREIWVQGGDVLRGKSGPSGCALGGRWTDLSVFGRFVGHRIRHHRRGIPFVHQTSCSHPSTRSSRLALPPTELDRHDLEDPPWKGSYQARLSQTIDVLRVCGEQPVELDGQLFAGRLHPLWVRRDRFTRY
jgi:hypothetical protein